MDFCYTMTFLQYIENPAERVRSVKIPRVHYTVFIISHRSKNYFARLIWMRSLFLQLKNPYVSLIKKIEKFIMTGI